MDVVHRSSIILDLALDTTVRGSIFAQIVVAVVLIFQKFHSKQGVRSLRTHRQEKVFWT
jgi:hypothetical protein